MSAGITFSTQKVSLTVETDLNLLTEVVEWFEQFNRPPLPHSLWVEGQIALIEGFTNAVRHAHRALPKKTPIVLEINISPDSFRLWIWDQGKAFDFDRNLQAVHQLTNSPDFEPLAREAQWGSILLLKLTTDYGWNISYDRPLANRNCLRIERTLPNLIL